MHSYTSQHRTHTVSSVCARENRVPSSSRHTCLHCCVCALARACVRARVRVRVCVFRLVSSSPCAPVSVTLTSDALRADTISGRRAPSTHQTAPPNADRQASKRRARHRDSLGVRFQPVSFVFLMPFIASYLVGVVRCLAACFSDLTTEA